MSLCLVKLTNLPGWSPWRRVVEFSLKRQPSYRSLTFENSLWGPKPSLEGLYLSRNGGLVPVSASQNDDDEDAKKKINLKTVRWFTGFCSRPNWADKFRVRTLWDARLHYCKWYNCWAIYMGGNARPWILGGETFKFIVGRKCDDVCSDVRTKTTDHGGH